MTSKFTRWMKNIIGLSNSVETSCEVGPIIQVFVSEYELIAREISNHLRYERDFLDQKRRNREIYDPFSIEPYSRRVNEVADKALNVCSTVVIPSGENEKELDAGWILLCQTLVPCKPAIVEELKEAIRVQLGSRLLISLWRRSEETLGSFIRRYYDLVYRTPETVISGTFTDDLMRLLKDCVEEVHEIVSAEIGPSEDTVSDRPSRDSASSEYVLRFALDRHGISEKADLRRLKSFNPARLVITLVLFLITASVLFDSAKVISNVSGLFGPTIEDQILPFVQIGSVAILVVFLFSFTKMIVQYLRLQGLKKTIATLVVTQLLPSTEVRSILTRWFGAEAARGLLRKN